MGFKGWLCIDDWVYKRRARVLCMERELAFGLDNSFDAMVWKESSWVM